MTIPNTSYIARVIVNAYDDNNIDKYSALAEVVRAIADELSYDVVTSASSQGACFDYDFCPYLKTEMSKITFNIEPEVIESIYWILGIESPTNKKQRDRERRLIRS